MKEVSILGVKINVFTKKTLRQELGICFRGARGCSFAKINSEFLLRASKKADFAETLAKFDYGIADGIGVLWAAKFLSLPIVKNKALRVPQAFYQGFVTACSLVIYPKYVQKPIPERIPGVDCLYLMLEATVETESPVYLFGAEQEILDQTKENLEARYSQLRIVGSHHGYGFVEKEIIDEINRLGPKLLVVALGSPRQEKWIRANLQSLPSVRVIVGEGGSFDFIAGAFKRAPRWLQRLGLEWLWRLFMNKSKTQTGSRFKRIWQAVPVFMWTVVKYKIKYGANKSEEQ